MAFSSFVYPEISPELSQHLFQDDKQMVVIGVIGKSAYRDCNKMAGFNILNTYPSLYAQKNPKKGDTDKDESAPPRDGQITFYFEKTSNILYVHFVTLYDSHAMEIMIEEMIKNGNAPDNINSLNAFVRTRFAQILLFAIQVCHIIVLVETNNVFDSSYLWIFKALKTIREKYVLAFLPKLLKNSNAGTFMGKDGRLCSPRFIFYFEKGLIEYNEDLEALQKLEFDTEDKIYKMLRNEFIITNNSSMSLFSIPRNKRFVYINSDTNIRADPLIDSIDLLIDSIGKTTANNKDRINNVSTIIDDDELDIFRPNKGFAKPLRHYKNVNNNTFKTTNRNLINLLKEHVNEAIENGFDDSVAKYKGKSHFVIPTIKTWYETFKIIYKIFIENPDNPNFEANDPDYKAFLDNFKKLMDVDNRFFTECAEYGLELAIIHYKDMLPHHYSQDFHIQKIYQSLEVLLKYARINPIDMYEQKLRTICNEIWINGKQQCEHPSLRNNPCIMPKHDDLIDENIEHSSGVVYISTCNCGRTQGRRDDPFTIRHANYDFYLLLANNCAMCNKLEKINFAVFQPSINDFRAAKLVEDNAVVGGDGVDDNNPIKKLSNNDGCEEILGKHMFVSQTSPVMTVSQVSETNLSLNTIDDDNDDDDDRINRAISVVSGDITNKNEDELISKASDNENGDGDDDDDDEDDDDSVNEIVIKIGESTDDRTEKHIIRQPSTTEYLPGMVHTLSPSGLLPQFPSWSLVCIGSSSVYSHNNGLPEHIQSGFLTGANFLLPWDVHVRLEHAASWAASYEKSRSRKKHQITTSGGGGGGGDNADTDGQVFVLKIFIGCEYECPRGHRFIMNTPDKVMRGGSGIVRDSGSKVVFNDMPLYFPCPCRNATSKVAQLMRIHIVTPKAPVNVILEPKICTGGGGGNGKKQYTFLTGLPDPPKLSQSAYWILRLPYIYHGDDGPILPPTEIKASNAISYGCLLAGMYGITETTTSK